MGFFSSFIHNEALAEILMEGHHPYAQEKLRAADLDVLRQKMPSTETLQAYVIGRIVGGGRGVWAATDRAVLLLDPRFQAAQRIEWAEVESFEAERGRFGHTVRLLAQGRPWSLYGADRELASQMHEAVKARSLPSRFDERQARAIAWREAAPAGWAQDCLLDARRRLNFA